MRHIFIFIFIVCSLAVYGQSPVPAKQPAAEKDFSQMTKEEKIAAAKAKLAASDTTKKTAEMTPYEEAAKSYDEGYALETARQYDKAQLSYDKAISIDPNFIEAYVKRGGIKFQKIEFPAAMEDYNRAIEIAENLQEMHEYKASIKNVLGDFEGSKLEESKSEYMKRRVGEAYFHRGHLKRFMEDQVGGCTDIRKALDLGYSRAKTAWPSLCQ
jgi:tetratricopeptide (TPR) repeat protein